MPMRFDYGHSWLLNIHINWLLSYELPLTFTYDEKLDHIRI